MLNELIWLHSYNNIRDIENNKIEILKNEQIGGKAVANWLKSKNVEVLITQLSHIENHKFPIFKSFIKSHK